MRADAIRNRESILRGARRLLAQRGIDVALDEIAAEAGVGPGTLHRHFPTKQSLLTAILAEALDERTRAAEEQLRHDPENALHGLIDGLLDDGHRNAALKTALSSKSFNLRDAAPKTLRRFDVVLLAALNAAKDAGRVHKDVGRGDVVAVLAAALTAQQVAPRGRQRRLRELVLRGLAP